MKLKRILCVLMVLALVLGGLPAAALPVRAEGPEKAARTAPVPVEEAGAVEARGVGDAVADGAPAADSAAGGNQGRDPLSRPHGRRGAHQIL